MVKTFILRAALCGLVVVPSKAWAVLAQTTGDLQILEDALRNRSETERDFATGVTPMLLAPPEHLWRQSRDDFASVTTAMLTEVFKDPGSVTLCPDCDAWRLHIRDNASLAINNGEISLADLVRLQKDPRYAGAKSVAMVRETSSGVEMRIVSIADGRILFHTLADSSATLSSVKPWNHYTAERDRRLEGDALSYSFINFGLYPNPLFQIEFVEQWGERNQHISGVGLSLINPNFALGFVYHYLLPSWRRLHIAGGLYYPLQNIVQNPRGAESPEKQFVIQGSVQYTFSTTFGLFVAGSSKGEVSLGMNWYNFLLLPFFL